MHVGSEPPLPSLTKASRCPTTSRAAVVAAAAAAGAADLGFEPRPSVTAAAKGGSASERQQAAAAKALMPLTATGMAPANRSAALKP